MQVRHIFLRIISSASGVFTLKISKCLITLPDLLPQILAASQSSLLQQNNLNQEIIQCIAKSFNIPFEFDLMKSGFHVMLLEQRELQFMTNLY